MLLLTRSARRVLGKVVKVGRNVTRAHRFSLIAAGREVNVPGRTSLKTQKNPHIFIFYNVYNDIVFRCTRQTQKNQLQLYRVLITLENRILRRGIT